MQGRAADAKFARLKTARRIWAVAAIHGEALRLTRLHDQIASRFADGDRIVYLGNYLGRGGAVAATLDELLDFRRRVLGRPRGFACDVVFLRGAQEEMWQKLLQLQFAQNPREVLGWMVRNGIEPTVQAYGADLRQGFAASRDGPLQITRWTSRMRDAMNATPGHTTLFSTLRHAAMTQDGRLLFVHAGIDPERHARGVGWRRRRHGAIGIEDEHLPEDADVLEPRRALDERPDVEAIRPRKRRRLQVELEPRDLAGPDVRRGLLSDAIETRPSARW